MNLDIRDFSCWHGQARALWDVNLTVAEGEIVGILGRNGAGKSTLLRALAGLIPRVKGSVKFGSQDAATMSAYEVARLGVSLLREAGVFTISLTVQENLELADRLARIRGRQGNRLEEAFTRFPLLKPITGRPVGLLSGGQRQALALAMSFVSQPSLLLLDEPSTGLAPSIATELFNGIREFATTGITILIVEQNPRWLRGLVARGYLLEMGKVTAEGPIEDIIENAKALEA